MIVQPDFPDHWKTKLLISLTREPVAPMCVIRFWAHCQNRRTFRFEKMEPEVLKAICCFPGDALTFYTGMLQTFADLQNDVFVAHGWDEINGKLLSNWENGQRGGRPAINPPITHSKPNDNPTTDSVIVGLSQQEPRRVEKSREDKNRNTAIPESLLAIKGFDELFHDILKDRKRTRKTTSEHWNKSFMAKMLMRPNESLTAMQMILEKGWQGFEWDWFDKAPKPQTEASRPRSTLEDVPGEDEDSTKLITLEDAA